MRSTRSSTSSAYASGAPLGPAGARTAASSQPVCTPGARIAPVSAETLETTSLRGVVVTEPRLPLRARRPSDLARLAGSLLLLAVPIAIGSVAVSTSIGLEQDLTRSFE